MGAYTCEFGVVHRMCRCPKPHTIKCDKVDEHGPKPMPLARGPIPCYRLKNGLVGKHEMHLPHRHWPVDSESIYTCPGRD